MESVQQKSLDREAVAGLDCPVAVNSRPARTEAKKMLEMEKTSRKQLVIDDTSLETPLSCVAATRNGGFRMSANASESCVICLEDEPQVRGQLDCCQHVFCYDCVVTWSKQNQHGDLDLRGCIGVPGALGTEAARHDLTRHMCAQVASRRCPSPASRTMH